MSDVDEYVEGCDYFIHDLYTSIGAFCPCVPDEVIAEWFAFLRGELDGSTRSYVRLLTGFTDAELTDLGGFEDSARAGQEQ